MEDLYNSRNPLAEKYANKKIILSVSNLIKTKGIDYNIKAFSQLIKKISQFIEYIDQLYERIDGVIITEMNNDKRHTSYSVNKGEKLVFCIRSRKYPNIDEFHDMNLLMYVVLHEMSHVARPFSNDDPHDPPFDDIFYFEKLNK